MQIEWKRIASKQLEITITYITENFGERYATEFYNHVMKAHANLSIHPEIGFPEPLLKNRKRIFRSILVHKHTKLIYYVDEKANKIFIADLWDIRREPTQLSKRIR